LTTEALAKVVAKDGRLFYNTSFNLLQERFV
jgi:hypothetical protein